MAPDPAEDEALLVAAAEAAGDVALRHFGTELEAREKADGTGPVTEADLEVNALLAGRLRPARPGYGWLSEEDPDHGARLSAERVFIVDPIDGTRAFLAGQEGFSVSVAIAERGRVIAAAVHLPARGETFSAARGQGARKGGARLAASAETRLSRATVLAAGSQLRDEHWPGGVPPFTRHFRPSLAWRICLVAEARFDTMLTFRRAFEWDIAAGALIAEEAGARVTDGQGGALKFNSQGAIQPGLIVAPPTLHAGILAHRRDPARCN